MSSIAGLIAGAKQLLASARTVGAVLLARSAGASEDSDSLTSLVAGPRGGLLTEQPATTHLGSVALEKSHVVSPTPCVLRSLRAINTSGSTVYLMVFDTTSLPADGAVPNRAPVPITTNNINGADWPAGTSLSVGCVVVLSSTVATLTLVSTACGWFDAEVS